MSNHSIDSVRSMIQDAAVFVPEHGEGIQINYYDDDAFQGTGEDSGEEYKIYYHEVDLDKVLIYRLQLMNP